LIKGKGKSSIHAILKRNKAKESGSDNREAKATTPTTTTPPPHAQKKRQATPNAQRQLACQLAHTL